MFCMEQARSGWFLAAFQLIHNLVAGSILDDLHRFFAMVHPNTIPFVDSNWLGIPVN